MKAEWRPNEGRMEAAMETETQRIFEVEYLALLALLAVSEASAFCSIL